MRYSAFSVWTVKCLAGGVEKLMASKFPVAEKHFLRKVVCMKCKTLNPKGAIRCRKCDYPHLRPKRARKKEGK